MILLLYVSLSLVFFEKWRIDYIEEVYHNFTHEMKYIVVAIKYSTKWAKAKIAKANNAKQVAKFFYKYIITRVGCSKNLISNRNKYF